VLLQSLQTTCVPNEGRSDRCLGPQENPLVQVQPLVPSATQAQPHPSPLEPAAHTEATRSALEQRGSEGPPHTDAQDPLSGTHLSRMSHPHSYACVPF
jgi:hypothetical protein